MPPLSASITPEEVASILNTPLRRPWMSWLLTGSILAVYVAQLLKQRYQVDVLGTELAVRPDALGLHRYGSLVTYAWAHALPLKGLPAYAGFHLASNVVPLFCLAPLLERRIGPWRLLALFCGGAIAAALAWITWRPGPGDAMIGASGALFALIAAAGVLNLRLWCVDFVFFELPTRLNLRGAALVLCAFEAVQMLWRATPRVAHIAHLGGALFGLMFALLFTSRRVVI